MREGSSCQCQEKLSANLTSIEKIIHDHKGQPDALIQVLLKIQGLMDYIPQDVLTIVAEGLDVSLSDVYGMVSFYSSLPDKPKGKHVISVCQGTSCYVKGSNKVIDSISRELDVEPGDTTKDGKFSIEIVRCLGACALGPVVMVDEAVHARLEPEKVRTLLKKYE